MPEDRTALEHLLDGRDALLLEVQRLNTAIEELDAVISRLGGGERRADPSSAGVNAARSSGWGQSSDRTTGLATTRVGVTEPIIGRLEADTSRGTGGPGGDRNRRAGVRPASATSTETDAPKSIRVHVLEMLGAQNREFGLAELIDGVHEAGIQAHDDAVRSITIKLMKDGKVERVGRGQYRLARPGSPVSAAALTDEAAPDEATLSAVDTPDAVETPDADTTQAPAAAEALQTPTVADEPDPALADTVADESPAAEVETPADAIDGTDAESPAAEQPNADQHETHAAAAPQGGYTPPLNLGQPWNR